MAVPAWLDDAAGFATCNTLLAAGGALVGTGVATMAAGGSGVVPLSLGMLSYLGAGLACNQTPVDGDSPVPGVDGCQQLGDDEYGWLQSKTVNNDWADIYPSGNWSKADTCNEIRDVTVVYLPDLRPAAWRVTCTFKTTGSSGPYLSAGYFDISTSEADARAVQFRIRPLAGQSCKFGTENPLPYPPNFHDPIQYTDPQTSCVYNITPQGFVTESDGGQAGFVMKIEGTAPQTLASGGVVGGCNFSPTLVYQPPGGGPPTTTPWDPDWPDWDGGGTPPWLATLIGAAGGAAATAVTNALEAIFEAKYPSGTREIYAACNYKQDGNPETFSVTFPEENYQNRVLTSLNAIVDFQQQILLWKTPTCSGGGSSVSGEPVTINWISDEFSGTSGDRVQKLLTYFDQTGKTQAQHQAHWKDFSWQAGPVIVSVNDVPLGKPQVWAASEAEGKRVINHAAAISGVDMTNASWLITSPRSSRFGLSGTMRVKVSDKGSLWVTKRDGPFGLPTDPA
jgi:hypothetical protein